MKLFFLLLLVLLFNGQAFCQRRIVGGSDATDGMFPFAVYVLTDGKATCTGSLVEDSWVLTAAHCVDLMKYNVKLIAGAANKLSSEAQTRTSKEVYIHNKYVKGTMAGYDIALVKVNPPFNLNGSNIKTIPLSADEWPQDRQDRVHCTALGWGQLTTNGKIPDVLQHVEVIAQHGFGVCPCIRRFEQKKILCLEGISGKGPCMGDSGGPLICDGKEVGITHMGFTKDACDPVYPEIPKMGCGKADTVVTYMYLCPELNWIRTYVRSVPPTPDSCSAFTIYPHIGLLAISTLLLLSINKFHMLHLYIF